MSITGLSISHNIGNTVLGSSPYYIVFYYQNLGNTVGFYSKTKIELA
jgi:hypothetical protein